MSRLAILLMVGLLSISPSLNMAGDARAQSSGDKAEALVRAGLKKARAGKFRAARDKFEQAVQLDPKAVYMHNLARALQKLGEHSQAHRWFAQALITDGDYKFAAAARKHLETIAKKLRSTHGRVTVQSTPSDVACTLTLQDGNSESLVTTPFKRWVPAGLLKIVGRKKLYLDGKLEVSISAGEEKTLKIRLEPEPREGYVNVQADAPRATVYLDGAAIGPAPVKSHVVTSGSYVIEVRAKGYKTFVKRIVVEPDATERVVARMKKVGAGGSDGNELVEAGSDLTVPGYVLAGAGAAVTVVGGVLVGVAYSKVPANNSIPVGPEGDSLVAEIQGFNAAGWSLLGVGLVAVGVGVYLIVSSESAASESAGADVPDVMPTFAMDGEGMSAGAVVRF